MKEIKSPDALQKEMLRLRGQGKTIGFVPTMGALHEGHLSLIRQAKKENDLAVASIFVNPLQFGPKEDFKKYPRVMNQDRKLLKSVRTDYLFRPEPSDMYPEGFATSVKVAPELTNVLCGKFRSGHFNGVATVVAKLLLTAMAHKVYFGAKDYQQSVVVRRMMKDLNIPTEMRLMPTIREKDGLAMSSRNRYLSAGERTRALAISETLFWLEASLSFPRRRESNNKFKKLDPRLKHSGMTVFKKQALHKLKQSVDNVQYLEIVDPETLRPLAKPQAKMVALVACFVGKTRLIDNVIIRP